MAVPTKQYGLILPQKKGLLKSATVQRPSVFGDDSDDETSVGESLQREAVKKKMMKQTRIEMQKALEQDSTVYDYDAVYDDIQKERLQSNKKILGSADKRPKYIQQLKKAVEDRKKEQERREERKIQKEREAEGEKFADKDAYVTSAYKQKLQEQKEEQERERREAAMEAALDVKKQQDLSGFYRHLLNQTVGEEEIPDRSAKKTPKVSDDVEQTSPVSSPTARDNAPSSASDNEQEQKTGFSKLSGLSGHSKRQYRQRSPSSESGEEKERQRERDRHKKSHRDRGRDRDRERERDRERDKNRGRERDDRHAEKRSDRDRRKDRERVRDERDDRDRTREDRHGKRDRSPKEREKNGDREKRRSSDEDRRKERNPEKEKGVNTEQKEGEKKETPEDNPETKENEEGKESDVKEDSEENSSKFAKRSTDQTVTSARERYLARQMARSACKSYIEKEED